jgi:perosamine synthetase
MNHDPIGLSSQDITSAEIDAVMEVMRSDRLSIGPRLDAFEAALAARVGRKYGIAVNSGTSGLHLCVKSLGIGKGDEVITTPFSFISTTNCLLFEDAVPVFVDIDPESYNMDPDAIEAAITPRTKAILPVEVFGNTAHFDAYEQIARQHDLLFIEDCCEALGGSLNGRPAGSFGLCGVFGFYPNKQITTGEGGMVVTDSEEIRDLCVSMRNQGRDGHCHVRLGYNYRMSESSAALGYAQLKRIDEFLTRRRQVAAWYWEELSDAPEIKLPKLASPEEASWFVYVIRLNDSYSEEDRDAIYNVLLQQGIGSARYFPPIHLQKYLRELLGHEPGDFPKCEALCQRTLALPFHVNLTREQVQHSADVLKSALAAIGR